MANTVENFIPFELIELIERGQPSCEVHKARRTDRVPTDEETIAVKLILLPADASSRTEKTSELDLKLKVILGLNHENLVPHLQLQTRSLPLSNNGVLIDCYCVLMEYCQGGTLHNAVKRLDYNPELYAKKWTRQICEGLKYLHENRIVHRDIKSGNILLSSSDLPTCTIKIADLGDYKQIKSAVTKPNEVSHSKGTHDFMSPEMMLGEIDNTDWNIGRKTDIWSLGCVVIQLLTGTHPRYYRRETGRAAVELHGLQIVFFVGSGGLPDIPTDISSEANDFVRSCLQRKPVDRRTAAEMLEHPFLVM
ncbi:uncharacterized protein LOC129581081 [Paramacrobiotus metropolitanus]|uniref:uncharacterized protein LOC129581081 n=1 Tax=Paramacrobiotus metropolitanus TaxID=2943436 RepID=UPI0024456241|nr:uncharacterized protein LOC129581081 [Paramacrobiotus metropolitanus]